MGKEEGGGVGGGGGGRGAAESMQKVFTLPCCGGHNAHES